ncbi:MAG: hypothetical protein R6W82_08160 [bacterium]
MLVKYVLFFLFALAFWRFLSGIADLGRKKGSGRFHRRKEREKPHLRGREVEDAEFEILPEEEEPPGPG